MSNTRHGLPQERHGDSGTSTHGIWRGMRSRCESETDPGYPRYGGRGIVVCERWQSYVNFRADMGERPEGMSIERMDNDGNYAPGNCRWATTKEQPRNRRTSRVVMFLGQPMTVAEAAERSGVPYNRLKNRIRAGMTSDVDLFSKAPLFGRSKGTQKLTWEQAQAIKSDRRAHREIAADYGVAVKTIGAIKQGRTYLRERA